MKRTRTHLFHAVIGAGVLSLLAACPGGGVPGAPGVPGASASKVNPNTCGSYAATDAGRKLKAFLEATVELEAAVKKSENYVKDSCKMMGKELSLAPAQLEGDTKTVCNTVINALKEHLQVGLKAEARLQVDYQPAVCTVNVEAAASAAAKCEAKAEADIAVRCSGTCSGTCQGSCSGKCEGAAAAGTGGGGAAGECNGRCEGTCEGSCTGGCEGHADVEASADCQAKAEVSASVDAQCTEPKLDVTFDAAMVVDKAKLEAAVRAIKKGMPRLLKIKAQASTLMAAFKTTFKRGQELAKAGMSAVSSLGAQATCVAGQIAGAVKLLTQVQVSIDVQVEVSASASGSIGGGA